MDDIDISHSYIFEGIEIEGVSQTLISADEIMEIRRSLFTGEDNGAAIEKLNELMRQCANYKSWDEVFELAGNDPTDMDGKARDESKQRFEEGRRVHRKGNAHPMTGEHAEGAEGWWAEFYRKPNPTREHHHTPDK